MSNTAIQTQTQTHTNEVAVVSEEKIIKYLDSIGLTKKLTDAEKVQFVEMCTIFNLNPFKREIYAVKYGNDVSFPVGFETYLKRAERTGLLDGWNAKTEGSIANGDLMAIVVIHRKDRSKPFIHNVDFEEFKKNSPFWQNSPKYMIKKVCTAQAFRLCFPDDIGGLPYTYDELGTSPQDVSYTETNETPRTESEAVKILNAKLEPNTKQWKSALGYLSEGRVTIHDLLKKFEISKENIAILEDYVKSLNEEVENAASN